MKATTPRPNVTTSGPRYGIELKMPASRPQTTYCWTPNHHSTSARRDGDDGAGEDLHAEEAADLLVDLVHDLDGDLLPRQRRSGDLHELPLVEIAGDQEEVDEEQHDRELSEEREQAHAAGPEIVARRERRLRRSAPA